jgi:P-type conjugative transfer protein TrbJ
MRHVINTPLILILALLTWPPVAQGIIPVIDEANIVNTTLTAFRALESNTNEAVQIAKQVEAYVQDAKHLVALPTSLIDQITSTIQSYYDLLQDGTSLAYSVTTAVQQFDTLYASGLSGNVPLLQRAQQMQGTLRDMGRIAVQAQAIYKRLCDTKDATDTLLRASQAAPGSLAAQQAGNQLLGVLIDQQGALQQIHATASRVQTSAAMRDLVSDELARTNADRWLADMPRTPFRGPGQGQGFKLPD